MCTLKIRKYQLPEGYIATVLMLYGLPQHQAEQGIYWWPSEVTAKNTVISPDFLVCKFWGKAQFLHGFGRFAGNYAETVPFRKICTPGNQVKLRYFSQWILKCILRFFFSCPNIYLLEITTMTEQLFSLCKITC